MGAVVATNRPSNPAYASGPGALSRRTDGGPADKQPMRALPDAQYGENKAYMEQQAGAPMYAESGIAQMSPPPPKPPGLFDETERPDEPVTSGIASGPGEGPEQPVNSDRALFVADAKQLAPFLPDLMRSAKNNPDLGGFVRFVRTVRNLQGA